MLLFYFSLMISRSAFGYYQTQASSVCSQRSLFLSLSDHIAARSSSLSNDSRWRTFRPRKCANLAMERSYLTLLYIIESSVSAYLARKYELIIDMNLSSFHTMEEIPRRSQTGNSFIHNGPSDYSQDTAAKFGTERRYSLYCLCSGSPGASQNIWNIIPLPV